jgi:hypothetical protein
LAQVRASQRKAERRRNFAIVVGAFLVACGLVAGVVLPIVGEQRRQAQAEAASTRGISGVETFSDLSRDHVSTPVSYPQPMPVGGDHAPVWANCGTYAQPVQAVQAVHSLEHGAVWIGYRPDLESEQLQQLTALADANSYVLLSPAPQLPTSIVLSAWGVQLKLDDAADPRLADFVRKYQQGPQTPEPGAACTGGEGAMS